MPLRSHSSYRTRPPTRVGEPLFERRQFSERDGAEVFDGSEVEVGICASCNQAIRDPKELGGHCFRCDRVVCTSCADTRCAIHRMLIGVEY